jgi:hypothetical protein
VEEYHWDTIKGRGGLIINYKQNCRMSVAGRFKAYIITRKNQWWFENVMSKVKKFATI